MNKYNKFHVLTLIFISVVINYMDRTNISVAATSISEDLALTPVDMGIVFSAFAWTYSVMQIPGGMIVDTVRVRILYPFILIAWSIATIVQGLVSSLAAMVGCRMIVGAFEAPSYPANNKIVTQWFHERERASAIAVYTSGQFIGLAFLMPLLALIQDWFGWRGLFFLSGVIGIAWAAVWYFLYRDNTEGRVRAIPSSEDSTENLNSCPETESISWANIRLAFSNRKLWGIYIGQFCLGSTLIFFLTWFPTYLAEYRGLGDLKTGFLASIPFIAAFFGVLCSGFSSDWLVRRGYTNEFARKTPVILGLFLSGSVVAANYVDSMAAVTFFLSLAFFGNGLASINWVFVSLIAPRHMVGLVGGCFNFIGGLSAVIIPVAIGFLVQDGDFRPALILIGGLALTGVCSYLFLVGRVEEISFSESESEKVIA
ncbi:MFS transporter, ACS family, D-galactonate transporter [Microbulbifer thermotolerans]|uniref:MFS transporter n=1 Tax=Microbulbifer thermotolerans TaxID=252514 RepID=UPI0008E732CA|nr:MFS transporter [Microbulbifer thermotolerans]SFC75332.1 MFS transporter, ACS family, D-galactonate transporter [Microbulbifer thermotolerans]